MNIHIHKTITTVFTTRPFIKQAKFCFDVTTTSEVWYFVNVIIILQLICPASSTRQLQNKKHRQMGQSRQYWRQKYNRLIWQGLRWETQWCCFHEDKLHICDAWRFCSSLKQSHIRWPLYRQDQYYFIWCPLAWGYLHLYSIWRCTGQHINCMRVR